MRFDILTIFPNIFDSYLNESIIKRAIEEKHIEIHVHNIRDYTKDKHGKVDDIPYGGGPGMVMTPQPLYDCIQAVKKKNPGPLLYMSPRGKTLTQAKATKMAKNGNEGFILLCGRYEGIDQRIIDLCVDEELSIGKYVLTGGELPAMVFVDVVSRLIPGVLGDDESSAEESFSPALKGKKEYPHYTRPASFKGLEVPEILRSGDHAKIKKWRENNCS
ncbi:MAG: tRNA (guanosine(37)-N1)-methyltransferase TrmD [Candidatus Gracilibacteria bacterium]